MLFDLVDTLQKKQRLIFVVVFILFDLWLLVFCNQILQAHRSDITTRIHHSESAKALRTYQSDVYVDSMLASIDHGIDATEIGTLRTILAATDGITKTEYNLQTAAKATGHAATVAMTASLHAVGTVITGSLHVIGSIIVFTGRVLVFPFVAVGHGTGYAVGAVSKATSSQLASVIQPKSDIATVPVITPEQAQQASIIQSGTLDVKPIEPIGSGGACDSGGGNGGYPMDWCDAPMDTIQTVSYSSDHINRECTSYAYWYFTTVEGHSDFHVMGNANRWARTSNYPTHVAPTVGAIAVETGGYYGHVAIVQALSGQTYGDQVVPDGYVLVSEMNYDWHGHFRYSYSPLSKFSAYIYP